MREQLGAFARERDIGTVAVGITLPFKPATATETGLPEPVTRNGITYVTGGIGEDEANAMMREAKRYPVSMVFSANKRNEYLADVHVTIKDNADKEVLDTVSEGPIMLLKLPAGEYTVEAEVEDKALHRKVRVSETGKQQITFFHWPHV